MKFNSITFKLLFFVICIFFLTSITVLVLANLQMAKIIDKSQESVYSERIDTLLSILQNSHERLEKTGLIQAYEAQFKEAAIKNFEKSFYRQKNQEVFPFILDTEGRVIMHPTSDKAVLAPIVENYSENILSADQGNFIYLCESKKCWCLFKKFSPWDWIIGYTVPLDIKYADAIKFRKKIVLIFLGFSLIAIILVFIVISKITKPILRLTDSSRLIAQGNLDQQIKFKGNDEIGVLAKTFDLMRLAIKEKIDELNKEVIDRKQAEKEIGNLRNYLVNIIDSMPSVLIGVDKENQVTLWNEKARQITGILKESAEGQSLEKAFPPLSKALERVSQAIKQRRVCFDPRQARKVDDKTVYEDVTIYPLIVNGVDGAVIRVDDVTEQVRMEEVMVQSEKMLSVGGLAAGMAHEINNPLAGMIQSASLIRSRLENIDMPANVKVAKELGISMGDIRSFMEKRGIQRMIDAIHGSGSRAAEIVNGMLSFARKSDATISSHYPDQLMNEILELAATDYDLRKQHDFKSIEIIKQYDENLPLLPCEGPKIQQVLLNILRNGAQAMQTAGTVSPRFTLKVHYEKTSKMICMEIKDNGPGMDEKTRSKVFDPFFTTKPVGIGTGLGLSVSYFIITENHKGKMEVISEPGKGANFIIRLPVETEF